MSSFEDDGPSFYTLLHCRRIPAGFKGIIGERFPCVIYLKVLSGPWFKVVVCEQDNGKMAMREGWKEFLLVNEISISNFLLFHWDGNLSFYVQIFNPSGLERVPENQEQLEDIATFNGKKKRGRPRKYGKENHMLRAKKEKGCQDSEKEPSKKIPAFFKAFITQDAHQRLKIPLAFTEYIKGIISFTAFLKDRKSNVWSVETTKRRNQYSFDNGWPKFVEENDVQLGDFLVFQYDGKCTFNFKHFGSSMCEKEAKISKPKVQEQYEKGNDKEAETAENKYADLDNIYGDVHGEESDYEDDKGDNDVVVVGEEEDVDEDITMKESNDDEGDYDYNKDDNKYDDDEDDDSDVAVVEEKDVDEEVFKKEFVNDDGSNEEDAIFESGIVERPKINPYFVAKIHPSHRNYLRVPSDVIKQFNLKLPEYLFLFVKYGRGWKTKVHVWKDGRTWLSRWRPFCKWNNVQLDDRCICEFVPRDGGRGIFLQISIVKAGSW